jgi:hypothetical protein
MNRIPAVAIAMLTLVALPYRAQAESGSAGRGAIALMSAEFAELFLPCIRNAWIVLALGSWVLPAA